jgi:hypothetical protein
MFTRVVRFTGVSRERLDGMLARVRESGGPPEGVKSPGVTFLFDETQGTVVALQQYETVEDMTVSAKIFEAIDASETPGRRASVDACEVMLELTA